MTDVSRHFLGQQDRLQLDFADSDATHCVALDAPTGELRIAPIDQANEIVMDWRSRPAAPGAVVTLNIYLLSEGGAREALEDPQVIAQLESCAPLLFAAASEDDADLLAEALRGHLARLNATFGRH